MFFYSFFPFEGDINIKTKQSEMPTLIKHKPYQNRMKNKKVTFLYNRDLKAMRGHYLKLGVVPNALNVHKQNKHFNFAFSSIL